MLERQPQDASVKGQFDYLSAVIAALGGLVWGGLTWIGWGLTQGVAARHIPGYPSSGQITYYVEIPAVLLAICAIGTALCFSWPKAAWLGRLVIVVALLAAAPFLVPYAGGV